ncbi:BTB/POZ domain-containing protein SETH6-like [Pyrus communis]|uniref:BTB/POZ domain-containing protein SETH6-like n=1 Tax=Pyrus communis TaxID=23211 RepID=UPI0035BFBFA5
METKRKSSGRVFDMLVPMRMPISDVSSDITVKIGASSLALHKFPLVSKSGRIRKLLLEAKDAKVSRIILASVPGGPEGFELAAKFMLKLQSQMLPCFVA